MLKVNNIISFFSIISWKITCDFLYKNTFSNFEYYGIELNINNYKIFESYFVIIICFLLFINRKVNNVTYLLIILFLFQLIPLSTYYSYADQSEIFFRTICLCFFSFLIVNNKIILKNKIAIKTDLRLIYVIMFGFFIVFLLTMYNGLPSADSFNLYNVYSRRSSFISYPFAERLNSILNYVISPILLLYAIKTNDIKFYILSIFFTGTFFLLSGGKYALFTLVLMPVFYMLYDHKNVSNNISRISLFITITCIFLSYTSSYNTAINYSFNQFYFRTFITPAWLSYVYFEVFQFEDFYYFSETFSFVAQKSISVPELVGNHLFSDDGGSFASNGFFGDAYANLGIAGIILISIVFNVLIITINCIKKNIILTKILPVYISINGFFLINSTLLSLLSSRGLLIGLILILLIKEFKNFDFYSFKILKVD